MLRSYIFVFLCWQTAISGLVAGGELESPTPEDIATLDSTADSMLLQEDGEEGGESLEQLGDDESDVDDEAEENRNGSSSAPSSSKRLWGAAPSASEASTGEATDGAATESSESSSTTHSPQSPHFSFPKRTKPEYTPPEGFVITARVFIDPSDRMAHLDEDPITLPYWDCGITGSTTSPVPVRDAAFRHSVTPTTPWTGTDGKHPLLAVALSPLVIETNSGESKQIQAGQVILLEDVLIAGHKLLPTNNQELQVLFLTLPQTHYHPGKDRLSLHKSSNRNPGIHPCPNPESGAAQNGRRTAFLTVRNIRRALLGMIGLSLSTLAADFFSKTAPLWLAVGVGGTCFVAAGTALTVMTGETAITSLEYAFEQRRLATFVKGDGEPTEASA
uniref:Transmembrane protein n=1 Tax=Entomoneis paludosa TaxID=265537 RepID=A0A7S2VEH0_9STRA|mmetsp:Transcript_19005/g.39350  ORF Transcript_19005/g.39350 Transcript_19005/m.39350 type:complete len:389 (+) Transcript_19005:128-1294(+)